MRRRVILAEQVMQQAPEYVRAQARIRFEQIADGLKEVPEDNVFWESMAVSRPCLVVHGWSFLYAFAPGVLRVTEAVK